MNTLSSIPDFGFPKGPWMRTNCEKIIQCSKQKKEKVGNLKWGLPSPYNIKPNIACRSNSVQNSYQRVSEDYFTQIQLEILPIYSLSKHKIF